jgi:hypothetical protein
MSPSSETMIAVGAMLVTFALAMLIGGVVGVRWWLPLFAFLMADGRHHDPRAVHTPEVASAIYP